MPVPIKKLLAEGVTPTKRNKVLIFLKRSKMGWRPIEIQRKLKVISATAHLATLFKKGLIRKQKRGKYSYYFYRKKK